MRKDADNLVVFYYFGHGISEPLSRIALLVPEDFVDQPGKEIRDLWGELILPHEIVHRLQQLPGRVLVLVDARRSRQQEKEIRPEMAFEPVLPPGFAQALTGLELVPMPNYFSGPKPVIFHTRR